MNKKSKRVEILEQAAKNAQVPTGVALKLAYALEQMNYQIVPTDETLEYYKLSKDEANELSAK